MRWRSLALGLWIALAPLAAWGQTSCSVQNQVALLAQFSDSAGPGTITPANIRNIICSTQQTAQPGASVLPQTVTTSPQVFVVGLAGYAVVSSGRVELSRDNGVTFYLASLTGGSFPVSAFDQIKVTWYSLTVPPLVTLFPNGQ